MLQRRQMQAASAQLGDTTCTLKSALSNMGLARQHPEVMTKYITTNWLKATCWDHSHSLWNPQCKVAEMAATWGKGHWRQIKSAYRLFLVHPQDRPLQAVEWKGEIYVDPMLPFGLQSAPKIFYAVADTLKWYLCQSGIDNVKRYLNDFIVVGPPSQPCLSWTMCVRTQATHCRT